MKINMILLSMALGSLSLSATAIEIPGGLTKKLSQNEKVEDLKSNALVSYAASQLGMSEATVTGGLGSLFKVAQDNLTKDNFSTISSALPDMSSLIKLAPAMSTSSITSLLGKSDAGKTAASVGYLNSAFKELGIPTESIPLMVSTVSGYLESNGYGEAAGLLKQGLSFL